MKRLKDESGQALIITALAMTCLLGFVALATDVGVLLREKRLVQIAADSAAIAGAAELNYTDVVTAAQTAATQNGFTSGTTGATVTVNGPVQGGPQFGPYAGNNNYVEVIVSQDQPTVFMGLFGRSPMTVTARAVATNGTTKNCIYTLGPTTAQELSITGSANIQIPTCGIIDDSNSGNALRVRGNATVSAQSIGVVGGVSVRGGATVTPAPVTPIVAASDPLSFLSAPTVPTICLPNPNFNNGSHTLTPGCYTGLSAGGTASLTLGSGQYLINGTLNLASTVTLTGTNVTLVLLGSSTFPANTAMNLTAPTTGTYNGVLIYQPLSNTNSLALTENSGATLNGIVYAPGAAVTITGNSGSSIFADFVSQSLSLVGPATFNDYGSINANSVLTSVKLVE